MTGVLAGPDDVPGAVLLDVRWALGRTDGHARYLAGHLPGAVYVDLDTELAAPPSAAGRHPLPAVADLQAAARRWGISAGSRVVVYDDGPGIAAARAWWLLRWGRHVDVSILDGGLAGVGGAPGDRRGGAAARGRRPVPGRDAGAHRRRGGRAARDGGLLLDARAPERFRGEVEPVDPVAGHVPGAVNLPATDLLADGRFRPDLAAELTRRGVTARSTVGVHCGSASPPRTRWPRSRTRASRQPSGPARGRSGWPTRARPVATGD